MNVITDAFSAYFGGLTSVTREDFFHRWYSHIEQREAAGAPADLYEYDVLKTLYAKHCDDSIACFRGTLTEQGFENLILPHHVHGALGVPSGGQAFLEVVRHFRHAIASKQTSDCVKKVRAIDWANILRLDDQAFLWMCNSREDAHPGHYSDTHGQGKIYMGNGFHRLVSYGLWELDNRPAPVVYFVQIKRNSAASLRSEVKA